MRLRNSVKAIIVQENRLLTIQMKDRHSGELFHILPGGGQNPAETFVQALERECMEELGASVEVGELVLVREYLGWKYRFSHQDLHQIEFMFRCRLLSPVCLERASELDTEQTGVEWIPLDKLDEAAFYPKELKKCLDAQGNIQSPVYIGDVE